MNQLTTTPPQGTVAPQSPADAKALLCVFTIFDWMQEHARYNISAACRATGIERWAFYQAYTRPVVHQRVSMLLAGVNSAVAAEMERRWAGAVTTLFDIASDRNDEKAAVQAIRLIRDIKKDLEEAVSQEEEKRGPSEAALLMQKMKDMPKTIRAKRKIVEESIEIEPDTGEIVDGEVVDG